MSTKLPKKHGEKIKTDKLFRPQQGGVFERRKHDRFLVTQQFYSLNLTAKKANDEDFPVEGWATDLSISGVGACVEHFLPKDTIVAVELVGETEPKALTARVAWCNKLPSTGRVIKKKHFKWRMGLEFKFNNEEEKKLISKLVERA